MYKIVVFCCCFVMLQGLSLQESVEKVLQNSHKIKEQEYLLERLKSELGIYQAGYYPKIDLSYRTGYRTDNKYGSKAGVSAGINLFNGLQDSYQIKKQEQVIQSQNENLKKAQEEVRYLVKKLYTQILLTKGRLGISEESLKLLEIQLKQAKQFYNQGISPKNNVLNVEVSVAKIQLDINSYLTQLNYLLFSMEQLIGEPVAIEDLQDLPFCEEEVDYDRLSLVIFEYSPQYRALQKQKQALLFELSAQKGNYYPKIDLSVGGDVPFGGKLYGEMQGLVQLGVSLNLFDGLKDSKRIQMKRYEIMGLESKIANYKRELLLDLKNAVGKFNLAKDQHILAQKAIESAQENYRIVSNRYKQKLETSADTLDAELKLKDARAKLLEIKYEIWENLFYIQYLIGNQGTLFF